MSTTIAMDPTILRSAASINAVTGFESGDTFATEADVRRYFTLDNLIAMFGAEDIGPDLTQGDLIEMADAVIANRWHCGF